MKGFLLIKAGGKSVQDEDIQCHTTKQMIDIPSVHGTGMGKAVTLLRGSKSSCSNSDVHPVEQL